MSRLAAMYVLGEKFRCAAFEDAVLIGMITCIKMTDQDKKK